MEKLNTQQQESFNDKKDKINPQDRFEMTFLKLQELALEVNEMKAELEQEQDIEKGQVLLAEYIGHRVEKLESIGKNYLEL